MTTFLSNELTVEALVVRAQAGENAAREALFERFQKTVIAMAYNRLRDWDEAEELCQDVFIQVFRRIDQLQTAAAFPGWLRQIVHRMAINRVTRSKAPFAVDSEILEATCVSESTPLDSALNREVRSQVRQGLERLGDMDRDTLTAFYLQGQSLVEMSEAFNAPIGTIKRRLHVARKRLAREVEELQAV